MAEVRLAALLVCALVLQVRAQGNPEPCGNGGQCQGRCYTAYISSYATVQTQVASCPSNANRPACCTGPTPTWQWSAWGACSGGTYSSQTRYQVCRAANGEDATFWDCPAPVGSYSENQACSGSTGSYEWSQWAPWTGCGVSTAQATRTRYCRDLVSSTIVSSQQCGGGLDQESKSCYSWSTSFWGPWSGCTSGQVQETRSPLCVDVYGQQAPAYLCTSPAPVETRPCQPTYSWSTTLWGPWSGCTSGQAQETRSPQCVDVYGQQVPAYLCPSPAPVETRPCQSTYSWSTSLWGPWSGCTSGQVQETRSPLCVDVYGQQVPAYLCTSPAPVQTRPCQSTYSWSTSLWGPWSGCTSGQVQETRSPLCVDVYGQQAPAYLCPTPAPVQTRPCQSTYSWSTSLWGPWSGCTSGQVQETRSPLCVDVYGQQVPAYLCPSPAPVQTRGCQSTYSWSTSLWGPWSGCTSGQVQETRSPVCVDVYGQQVPAYLCPSPAPVQTRACQSTYSWSTSLWGPWSGCTSGQVQETRSPQCVDVYGQQVPASLCPSPAPVETRPCTSTPTFYWSTWASWSSCSGTPSTSTRTRTCLYSASNVTVLSSYCSGGSDSETKPCYTWSDSLWGSWSSCSGSVVESTRQRLCVDATGAQVTTNLCPYPAPTEVRLCSPYNWGAWGTFGSCRAPCGQNGLMYRWKVCEDVNGTIFPDDLCAGDRPVESTQCYNDCSNTPQWTAWGQWSSACDYPQCTKTRDRSCTGSSCVGLSQEVRACYVDRCGSVSFGDWSAWSTCDSTCRQYRTRVCLSFTACAGPSQESQACNCPSAQPEDVCGKFYYNVPRLINGNNATDCRWPWMANVRLRSATGTYTSLCSAVLIDQNTLVTSAVCISRIRNNQADVQIVLNDQEPLKDTDTAERAFLVRELSTSSKYTPVTGNLAFSAGNIGVIHLSSYVGYTDPCIQPVCLPDANTQFNSYDNYVAAFGRTAATGPTSNVLKEAVVRVANTSTCQGVVASRYNTQLSLDLICSNYQGTNQPVMCVRDEGGMLVAQDAYGAWVLRGINVDSTCDVTQPNMFVDVKQHVPYLESEMVKYP